MNYHRVSNLPSPAFTTYMSSFLKERYPDLEFADIDHYAGSLIVETTVYTSSKTKKGELRRCCRGVVEVLHRGYGGVVAATPFD